MIPRPRRPSIGFLASRSERKPGRDQSFPRPLVTAAVPERPTFLSDAGVQKWQGQVRLRPTGPYRFTVDVPRRFDHALVLRRSSALKLNRRGIDLHAPLRIELVAVARRKRQGVTVAVKITHDADRGDLLDEGIPELLFLTLFRRGSPTRRQRRDGQADNAQMFPHRGEPPLATFFSIALAPLRIPNMP